MLSGRVFVWRDAIARCWPCASSDVGVPPIAAEVDSSCEIEDDVFCFQHGPLQALGARVAPLADFSLGVDHAMPGDILALVPTQGKEGVAHLAGMTWLAGKGRDLAIGGDAAGWDLAHHIVEAFPPSVSIRTRYPSHHDARSYRQWNALHR